MYHSVFTRARYMWSKENEKEKSKSERLFNANVIRLSELETVDYKSYLV